MPTVLRIGPYRFFFYSSDGAEPIHIHVERDRCTAKYWIDPVRLHSSRGFSSVELVKLHRLVEQHRAVIEEAWNEYFGR